jgi:hypothetical protein
MRAVDHPFPFRNLFDAIDEDRTFGLQLLHNVAVVDDFLADIDGRPKSLQSNPHNVNCANYPSAESAGL